MKLQGIRIVVLILVAGFFATGCTVAHKAKPASAAPVADPGRMTLRAGDVIELKFPYSKDFNDTQRIRPDGNISLQLLGDVKAAGQTPAELSQSLEKAYGDQLKNPQVTVIVREAYQRKVYVAGNVLKPGLVEMPADISVLDAVMMSGGFDTTKGELSAVVVLRHEGDKTVGYKIDLSNSMVGGETKDFLLQPQDIVYVPNKPVVDMNVFVSQYVLGLVPGLQATTSVGSRGLIGVDTSFRQ